MKPIRSLVIACAATAALVAASRGQEKSPQLPRVPVPDAQVDTAEIARWGDHVQHIDGSFHAGHETTDDAQYLAGQALSLPPDDNHKWFITVIGTRGCPACARLRADIKADQQRQANLGAFITLAENDENHSSTERGWSHYNYILAEDKSQAPFVDAVKPKAFPTIVLQTPLNGKYGKPGVVVFQRTGYDGDATKLANQLADAIRSYLAKLADRRNVAGPIEAAVMPPPPRSQLDDEPPLAAGGHGQRTPPFTPPPLTPDNTPPLTPDQVLPPTIPPAPKPDEKPKPDDAKPKPDASGPPEAIVVYDKHAAASDDQDRRIRTVVERLKAAGKVLTVRMVDFRDAPELDVPKENLPAVVVTAEGRVIDRITDRLLPLVAPTDDAPREIGLADVPWDVILTLVMGGSIGVGGFVAIGVFIFKAIRAFRIARGKTPILDDATAANLLATIKQLVGDKNAAQDAATRT